MKSAILLGIILILSPLPIVFAQGEPCDFNGNGHPDVTDLLRFDGLLDGCFTVDTLPDYWFAGDCDQDSISATVADEIALGIRLIQGYVRGQMIESAIDTVSIPNATAAPGQTISLPVHIRTARALNGAQFFLRYDPTILSITNVFQPDSEESNGFTRICYYGSGASASAIPFVDPDYFHDPLVYITVNISPNAPTPSQARIEFADDPNHAAYTGFAVADSEAVPPAPDIFFIRPIKINGVIDVVQTAVSEETAPSAEKLALDVWANPANLSYEIAFHLPQAADIDLNLYDLLGRRLTSLASGRYDAGDHALTWTAGSLGSGIYFLRLTADNDHVTRKITLLK